MKVLNCITFYAMKHLYDSVKGVVLWPAMWIDWTALSEACLLEEKNEHFCAANNDNTWE